MGMISASVAQLAEHHASNVDRAGSLPVTRSISPPQWFVDRMEALKKMPPPTLEEVQAQFAASANFRETFKIDLELKAKIRRGIPIR